MSRYFQMHAKDCTTGARVGKIQTPRGVVDTPAFMPVGTQAAVKTLTPEEVLATGSQIILANTYHLWLRPGLDVIRAAGSVHEFMGWSGPILTDSGGFQVFSLSSNRRVTERGVEFRSHLDGRKMELTPERAIELQLGFGSDIMMPLDELIGFSDPDHAQREAAERTQRWLKRSTEHFQERTNPANDQRPLLFGISQGGFDASRRREHAERTAEHDVDGHSIGGLSVGEPKREMFEMLEASISGLPAKKPRYLMGVGSPEDLWIAVANGVDMFDCVHPTRVARRGALFTPSGRVNITAARYRDQFVPVDDSCSCKTCMTFSAAYVHHLFRSGEMLGPRLASIHNVHFIQSQMNTMRASIKDGTFTQRMNAFLREYRTVDETVALEQRARWTQRRDSGTERVRSK